MSADFSTETNTQKTVKSEKIVRRKLSDEVFDRLREMMTSGELESGDQMPSERTLMERFGVGRPAVREAMQSMQSMGFITISHGGRSRVNELSVDKVLDRADEVAQMLLSSEPDQLEHLKEARRMFETGMVSLAAKRATPENLDELSGILEEQRSYLGQAERFMEADTRFHTCIANMTGNPIMGAVSSALLRWLFKYHTSTLHWSGNEEVTLSEHAAILELLRAGDASGAVEKMREHLDRSNALYQHEK
ncbi:GntR family transcriptional regulator [Amylibacter ulvae]|uniref:GntR family transcriptional regulator n=1 Tax=Paramylibacter ulvae TaxID=1651968 RepID=A0ABQ3CVT4_9RHOB|nr:transcriptional regulator NanR [Amylibacter ulvae]GHA44206.1 GntR family transcriptional regulator [Amylibacter ulvae]